MTSSSTEEQVHNNSCIKRVSWKTDIDPTCLTCLLMFTMNPEDCRMSRDIQLISKDHALVTRVSHFTDHATCTEDTVVCESSWRKPKSYFLVHQHGLKVMNPDTYKRGDEYFMWADYCLRVIRVRDPGDSSTPTKCFYCELIQLDPTITYQDIENIFIHGSGNVLQLCQTFYEERLGRVTSVKPAKK